MGKTERHLAILAVVLAAALPYLGVLDSPFVFDDVKLVKENKLLREGWDSPAQIVEIFDITSRRWDSEELRPNYRPLRFLSYLVDWKLSRWWFGDFSPDSPPVFFFHLSNVLLHAINALLVFFLARSIFRTLLVSGAEPGAPPESPGAARTTELDRTALLGGLWAALLFALHPLQTEAVTYISSRRDVLSTFFFLAALLVHLRAPGIVSVACVPILFGAGLLSKEMVITLPALLLLLDILLKARWSIARVLVHCLTWVVAIAFTAVTLSNPHLVEPSAAAGAGNVFLTAARYAARYIGLALFPYPQSVDYSYDAIRVSRGILDPWTAIPSLGVLALLGILGARGLISRSGWWVLASLGIFWFLGTLVPVLQFVPVAERFAERFAYLPLAGGCVLFALGVVRLASFEKILGHGLAGFLCLLALAGTLGRNVDWESPLDLWTSAVKAQPRAARAHLGRANALKETGRLREALEEYTAAIEIFDEKPEVPLHHGFILQALVFRGGICGILGKKEPELLERAVEDYRRVLRSIDTDGTVIESSPKYTVVHFDLAGFLLEQKKLAESREEYRRVIEIGSPAALIGAAHYYLAKIALLENDTKGAMKSYRSAYETIPAADPVRFQVAAEFADLLIDVKDLEDASRFVDRAIGDGASGKEKLHLLYRQAKILDRRGELEGCVELLKRILGEDRLYKPAIVTLAGIEVNLGKYEEAAGRYRALLQADPTDVEALQGLQSVKLQQKLAEEGKGGAAGPGEEEVLAAVEKKGSEHLARGELIAARETFANLLDRAKAAGKARLEVKALRELAAIDEKFGRFQDAEKFLDAALDRDPNDPDSLRMMGDLQLRRFENRALARAHYERYLLVLPLGTPGDPKVHFNLGGLLSRDEPLRALDHYEKARAGGFDPATVDWSLGYLFAELGQWEKSLDAFNRYLEAAGDEPPRQAVRKFVRETVLPHLSEGK